jgi:hypothetical protein
MADEHRPVREDELRERLTSIDRRLDVVERYLRSLTQQNREILQLLGSRVDQPVARNPIADGTQELLENLPDRDA